MNSAFVLAFAIHTIAWRDLPPPARRLATELNLTEGNLTAAIKTIRARNSVRLREGELDHLIFYMLQGREFTTEAPIDPAIAAVGEGNTDAVRRRMRDFSRVLGTPDDDRQKYFATLMPANPELFLEEQLARVLGWIREKEVGCRASPSPQTCIAALYVSRGHSSDTSPQSMVSVLAAFEWLRRERTYQPKRILIVGPGVDFAPRTALRTSPVAMYQPKLVRDLAGSPVRVDCVDLNPRVVRSAAGECESADLLDIATERLDRKYDAIIATNVLLYLNQTELLLALQNISAMLAENGVFIHNDARFETHLFGRAAGMPVAHFGTVTLDATRRPPLVDRFVIHSPAAPKL